MDQPYKPLFTFTARRKSKTTKESGEGEREKREPPKEKPVKKRAPKKEALKTVTLEEFETGCNEADNDLLGVISEETFGAMKKIDDEFSEILLVIVFPNGGRVLVQILSDNELILRVILMFGESDPHRTEACQVDAHNGKVSLAEYEKHRPEDLPSTSPLYTGSSTVRTLLAISFLLGIQDVFLDDYAELNIIRPVPLSLVRMAAGKSPFYEKFKFRVSPEQEKSLEDIKRELQVNEEFVSCSKEFIETQGGDKQVNERLQATWGPWFISIRHKFRGIKFVLSITLEMYNTWRESQTPEGIVEDLIAQICFLCEGYLVIKEVRKGSEAGRFMNIASSVLNGQKKDRFSSGQDVSPILAGYAMGYPRDHYTAERLEEAASRVKDYFE